ncbi:Coenzyme F420 hydrogenase/dehydrogenase, beta subunit C-terminal domain [Methanothermococcus sp.]|uniref:Coenzyme F420 hydrogenase/dehydrogenase, beta subunit C-terminal domain n=1 Tax=Methanothermococcus sp. TaxID=2614238 RepID=UPI0025EA3411|nr:Coenzyme F420 hydrogenase/dehydrogenase, beta subunit C-terminal domain [Methanothermococcus sp.]
MKSYLNLKEEVWDKNICSGCGACVAVCPVDNIYFKEDSPVKFVCDECACIIAPVEEIEHPVSAEFCKVTLYDVPCGACYDACPRTEKTIVPPIEKGIGRTLKILKAKSKIEIKNSQSGGVVTAILANAFDEDLIDGAIVMMEDKWTMEPKSYLATSKEEVLKSSGSRYNWNVPILKVLKEAVMVKKLKRIAVVGTPCVMNAVYQIMASDNDLLKPFKDAIRLKIGLFCFETYDYDKMMTILEENNINPWEVQKMDIEKGKLVIKLMNGDSVEFKLKDVEHAIRDGCKVCGDFTGITSDISVGNVGTPEGYSTVLVRNKWGKGFIDRAHDNGYIEFEEDVNMDAVKKLVELKKKRKNK